MIYKGKLVLAEGATLQKKRKAGLCAVKYCNATSGKNGEWKLCYKHHRQNQKLNNPTRYHYDLLRQNAKNRGKEFTLTIEEYREFCKKTGYMEGKGRTGGALNIDRKDNKHGYHFWNIQILTGSENSRKQWVDMKINNGGTYPNFGNLEAESGANLEDNGHGGAKIPDPKEDPQTSHKTGQKTDPQTDPEPDNFEDIPF